MSHIFNDIIKIGNTEDVLRTDSLNINNTMVQETTTKNLEYISGDFGNRIVLAGSKQRNTISDNNFNMEFSKKTFDLLTYIHWDNIVVAGGSLVNIITKSDEKLNDVDIFIYGLDKESTKQKIDHVVNSVKQKAIDMKYDTRVYMNSNVINIYVFDTKKLLQVQIILRLYDTLAHVLVGFDVDCCCVAYNGKNLLATERGLNALKYRVNVANLKRRSPSYENRLIKYSFRGFDVITDFKYENMYNKMFFMASENYGFTRLLEQELINNGQLKNIIFSNTLRFRQTASYTGGHSFYNKENLEIKNIQNTENCITKYNANIEDDTMKFKEYSIKNIGLMETGVMEQFTGSFNPISDENWVNSNSETTSDSLGRSKEFVRLKYNKYSNIAEFENKDIHDISNFGAKCLAVMYVANESDVVRIVENKYINEPNNMYRITPVKLAILLGRTKLAISLMKGHDYETVKELIYMMDNDKMFTNYCNKSGRSCTDVDKHLVGKFECENISDNIHNQNKTGNNMDEFYQLSTFDMTMKIGLDTSLNNYYNLDITRLPFNVIKTLYEKGCINSTTLTNHLTKKIKEDDLVKFRGLMNSEDELHVFDYVINNFVKTENKRCKVTNDNIKKLMVMKNMWNEENTYTSIYNEFNKINSTHHNLYTCMLNITNPNLTLEIVYKLIGASKAFDMLVNYVIFLDSVELIQKLITKDDLYVKLKYQYRIESSDSVNIKDFFNKIDTDRQNEKVKTNKILKNNDDHINAIVDGELSDNYERKENVFGMTPDDNIIAKLLLMYNKVFNKGEAMSDKDLTTLKNMRKAVHNIKRNCEHKIVNAKYFYSLDLHNLFFSKDDNDEVEVQESVIESNEEDEADADVETPDYFVLPGSDNDDANEKESHSHQLYCCDEENDDECGESISDDDSDNDK